MNDYRPQYLEGALPPVPGGADPDLGPSRTLTETDPDRWTAESVEPGRDPEWLYFDGTFDDALKWVQQFPGPLTIGVSGQPDMTLAAYLGWRRGR